MSFLLSSVLSVATATLSASSTSAASAELEAEFASALAAPESPPPQASTAPSIRLIEIALDLLAAGGTSTAKEEELRFLEGGGHDPKNRGFTMQNVELTLAGIVDPYLRGDANIVLQIDENGESNVELEEAYLTSLALPFNLQLKAGQFFTAFGRLNPTHPHAWDFVDQPVISSRLMGADGLRNVGVQLAWLTPLPFFFELTTSVQDAHGETAVSFRNAPNETIAGRTLVSRDVQGGRDLLYLLRAKTSVDLSEETTAVLGASGLFGPNGTGRDMQTTIGGVDLYVKWKPLSNDVGWPFFAVQAEGMIRRYDAAAVTTTGEDGNELALAPRDRVIDAGLYAQAMWGFSRPFVFSARYDFARGEPIDFAGYATDLDSLRDLRHRASAVLTYFPSEFSKIRLQYAYDRSAFLPDEDAHSLYLQAEIIFGAHGAHKF